ncbi:M20/M25/M40 family metallo-hydrolase [Cryomorphaceae bacterium 1068]|nr:M20/M25/M40 family metallo-hydrolase [Cryomorphaceae bacterium 1068]
MNTELLKKLCAIPSTAGDEGKMRDFILDYFSKNSKDFKVAPKVYSGAGFQDMVIAVFGEPRTAVLAHTDTVGFTVAYKNVLYKIGGPKAKDGTLMVGEDSKGKIECTLKIEKKKVKKVKEEIFKYEASRTIDPGTTLTYAPDWKETKNYVNSAYLDNRLGVWNALELARTITNGALVFTTYEEHGGGGAQFAGKFLQDNFGVQQALISDVTLLSDSIKHKKGVAISMRDRGIPRRSFVNRILEIARENQVKYQLEVEKAGGSDGNSLQSSSYAWDWCFIGPPEDNYHQPGEKVHKEDMAEMQKLYKALLESL